MIHNTAIIDTKAKIFENVQIGPYAVIGPNVEVGEGTIIKSHVNLTGNTKIGKNNIIYSANDQYFSALYVKDLIKVIDISIKKRSSIISDLI